MLVISCVRFRKAIEKSPSKQGLLDFSNHSFDLPFEISMVLFQIIKEAIFLLQIISLLHFTYPSLIVPVFSMNYPILPFIKFYQILRAEFGHFMEIDPKHGQAQYHIYLLDEAWHQVFNFRLFFIGLFYFICSCLNKIFENHFVLLFRNNLEL